MDMNNVNIEEIVKQVLSGMTGNAPAAAAATSAPAAPAGNTIPKKARVAMMTEKSILSFRSMIFRKLVTTTSLLKLRAAASAEQMLMSTKETHLVLSR